VTTHDVQVSVDGCHPMISETYKLCDGVVAIDYNNNNNNNNTYLLGLRGVPLIPNSIGMLLSEHQVRAYGIDVDLKPRCFGGQGRIVIGDSLHIPLNLERGLMTCPVRKPNLTELNTSQIYWLTSDQPWYPTVYDEVHTTGFFDTAPPTQQTAFDGFDTG
jgi:hypothetical protein